MWSDISEMVYWEQMSHDSPGMVYSEQIMLWIPQCRWSKLWRNQKLQDPPLYHASTSLLYFYTRKIGFLLVGNGIVSTWYQNVKGNGDNKETLSYFGSAYLKLKKKETPFKNLPFEYKWSAKWGKSKNLLDNGHTGNFIPWYRARPLSITY